MYRNKDKYIKKFLTKKFSEHNLIFIQINKLNSFEFFLLKKELFKRDMVIFSAKNKKVINIFKNSKYEQILKQILTGPTHIIGFSKKTELSKNNFLFLKQLNVLAIIYCNNILYKEDFNFILEKPHPNSWNITKIQILNQLKQNIVGKVYNLINLPIKNLEHKNKLILPIKNLNSKIYNIAKKSDNC